MKFDDDQIETEYEYEEILDCSYGHMSEVNNRDEGHHCIDCGARMRVKYKCDYSLETSLEMASCFECGRKGLTVIHRIH